MHRSTMIILGKPEAPLPPEAKARPLPARHWGNWRRSGVALSGFLHVLVLAALTLSVPVFGRPAPSEETIPVELVPRVPETKPPEPKPEEPKKTEEPKKPEEPKKAEEPKQPAPPAAKQSIPDPPTPAAPPPIPAAKTAPTPAAPQPQAAPPAPARPLEPPPALTPAPAPPPPEASLPPVPPPIPEAERPKGPAEGLKVDADEVPPPPSERKALGYWVLEPLSVNLRARCGLARITGVLELREQIAEGRYRGIIRTRIAWATCPAEGAVHAVELRIKDGEVEMIGANGSVDRGAVRGNTMLLEDAYGRSVWKKR